MEHIKYGIIGCGGATAYHLVGSRNKPNAKFEFVTAHDIDARQLHKFELVESNYFSFKLKDNYFNSRRIIFVTIPNY